MLKTNLKKQVVIAHYNERLMWLKYLKFPFIVYHKGEGENNWLKLKNIGREAHTYLHHIIYNYNNLADFTVFTQAFPAPHTKGQFLNRVNTAFSMKFYWSWHKLPLNKFEKNADFLFFSEYKLHCDIRGHPHHAGLPLGEYYKKIFGRKCPHRNLFFPHGAIFGVSKRLIRSKPIEFYKRVMRMEPFNAHCMERLWFYIFTDPLKAMNA